MAGGSKPQRGPLPLRAAMRLASRIIDPQGSPSEDKLREAVAGKVILVTGASHGIGRATARKLGEAGATVLLVARSADRLQELAQEIAAGGGTAHAHPADLSDPEAVDALAAQVLERHGHVDVLVSNAGKSIRRSIERSYDRFHDFERTIEINYLGPVKLVLALLPGMRERGEGHIVNVSTIGVRMPPMPRWAAYQASKAAFDVFLRSAGQEARADGVTVSTVYMALVHTRMSAPTPVFRYVPGLRPDEAADVVCQAIVERPSSISPWWVPAAELASRATRRPVDAGAALYYRLTDDSVSSKGDPRASGSPARGVLHDAGVGIGALRAIASSGVLAPVRPDRLLRMANALRLGIGPASGVAATAARYPDRPAIIDDRAVLTFAELDRRAGGLAAALRDELGIGPERGLAVMCRNHHGFVEATVAASRLGADLLLLNTEFPGPQLAQVLDDPSLGAVVLDEEFAQRFDEAGYDGPRVLAWRDEIGPELTLDALAARKGKRPSPPEHPGRIVILTSGTTGKPKGAPRSPSIRAVIGPGITLLSKVPVRAGEPVLVGPPVFHGFGLAYLGLGLALGSPLVLHRRFDAEATLAAIDEHGVGTLAVVPVMLQRILALPEETRNRYDTSSLRAVISAAAPLGPGLASDFMDAFGDVLYNLYGTTETGFGAIATPRNLRAAPGTVGRPPLGTTLKILDDEGTEVAVGETGRIFVGGELVFDGYSDGAQKEIRDGLTSTGDLGHLDAKGRLFIDGREDDMIVSGGENVFPQEVEDVLNEHEAVADVAVVGVADEEFGQRLQAFVVRAPDSEASEEELKAHVKSHLARFKVPREIVFVDELPRNPTGKVLRRALRA